MDDSGKILSLIRSSMSRSQKVRATVKSDIENDESETDGDKQISFAKFYKKKLQEKSNKRRNP